MRLAHPPHPRGGVGDSLSRWRLARRPEPRPPGRRLSSVEEELELVTRHQIALFGREGDLRDLAATVRTSRFTVLTGPAGVGKTRLARELARREAGAFADGAHIV